MSAKPGTTWREEIPAINSAIQINLFFKKKKLSADLVNTPGSKLTVRSVKRNAMGTHQAGHDFVIFHFGGAAAESTQDPWSCVIVLFLKLLSAFSIPSAAPAKALQ